jgi:acyl transferase domain-containing protein
VPVDFAALHEAGARRRVRLPTYPFERKRHFVDPPGPGAAATAPAATAAPQGEVERLLRTQMDIMSRQLALLRAEDEP